MGRGRIAMTGEGLNFKMARILPTLKPDLSDIAFTKSGEVVSIRVLEELNASKSSAAAERVSAETERDS
jgi:hypothetical protein